MKSGKFKLSHPNQLIKSKHLSRPSVCVTGLNIYGEDSWLNRCPEVINTLHKQCKTLKVVAKQVGWSESLYKWTPTGGPRATSGHILLTISYICVSQYSKSIFWEVPRAQWDPSITACETRIHLFNSFSVLLSLSWATPLLSPKIACGSRHSGPVAGEGMAVVDFTICFLRYLNPKD